MLLHPIAMRLDFWDEVADRLSADYKVIAFDLRGHGQNPPAPAAFTLDDLAGDVAAMLQAMKTGPAIIVGCSMGGMVAQALALRAPELVSGLVLTNTTHTMGSAGAEVMRKRAEETFKGLDRTIDTDLERWLSKGFRAQHSEIIEKVREWVLANDARTVGLAWQAIANLNFSSRLASITQPVLVTTGTFDPASPVEAAKRTAAAFANARFEELQNAGHFAPIERPDVFAALITEFADDALPAGG